MMAGSEAINPFEPELDIPEKSHFYIYGLRSIRSVRSSSNVIP